MSGVCPECAGEQMPDHPAGVLAIRHTNDCTIRAAEDSTAANDAQLGDRIRPGTDAERVLLAALGYTVPDELVTEITLLTRGVRHREHLVRSTAPSYRYPGGAPTRSTLTPIELETP